jgi:hypothetical protein
MMHRSALAATLVAIVIAAGSAHAVESDSDVQIPETEVIKAMQEAVHADDKNWFVKHLHYPVRYFGKPNHTIISKTWFLKNYATIIGLKLKEAILAQDPENFFKNYQGLMVGEGSHNIWLEDFGDPGGGIPSNYQIITINNTDR